jgi:hypothetical protein
LNRSFQEWTKRTPPSSYKGKQPKIFYVTQVAIKPPQFALFTGVPEGITPAYERYLENQLRATFDFLGTPVKLSFRARRKDEEVRTNDGERTRNGEGSRSKPQGIATRSPREQKRSKLRGITPAGNKRRTRTA